MGQNNTAYTSRTAAGPPGYTQLGKSGDLLTAPLHGEYYEAAYAGNVGIGGNTAGVTTSAALATTYVGCCLSNPAGSGKNLELLRATCSLIVAPTTITTIFLAIGYSAAGIVTHTTPLTPLNAKVGMVATGLVGLLDSACTLVGTPAYALAVAQASTATTAVSANVNLEGGLIIPPGGWAAFATNIAGPASGFMGFFMWQENLP